MARELFLEARDVSFAYQPDRDVIQGLNLSLYRGETAFLTGPNGAGKTTLGKLLGGILKPHQGQCLLQGEEISNMPLYKVGQRIGYCFQNPAKQLFAVTVEEEIGFGLKYRGANPEEIDIMTQAMLTLFDLGPLRQCFPHNLSWGEKRRTALAACMALQPDYLILDEPAAGLDVQRLNTLAQTLQHLREQEIGILVISHNQDFIRENAQRILVMEKGGISDDRCC